MFLKLGEGEDQGPVQTSASFAPPLEKSGNWDGSPSVALSRGACDGVVGVGAALG